MGDENKVEVSIVTTADNAGAQSVVKALDEVKGKATESGAAASSGGKDGAEGMGKLGRVTEETTKHTEKAVLSHRALHKIIHGLNEIVPGLGAALRIAMNPIAGTVMAAVGALVLMHKKIEEITKAAEEHGEAVDKGIGDAWAKAREEAEKYQREVKKVADQKITVEVKAKWEEEESKAMAKMREAYLESWKKEQTAIAEAQIKDKKELIEALLKIDLEYIERKRALEIQNVDNEAFRKRKAQEAAAAMLPEVEKELAKARKQAAATEAGTGVAKATEPETKALEARNAKLQEELEAAEKAAAESKAKLDSEETGAGDPLFHAHWAAIASQEQAQVDAIKEEMARNKQLAEYQKGYAERMKARHDSLMETVQDLEAEYKKLKKTVTEAAREEAHAARMRQIERDTTNLKAKADANAAKAKADKDQQHLADEEAKKAKQAEEQAEKEEERRREREAKANSTRGFQGKGAGGGVNTSAITSGLEGVGDLAEGSIDKVAGAVDALERRLARVEGSLKYDAEGRRV